MREGKTILAVIPARGGSKGIPMKNIHPVAGKPLISYTTELLREMPWVDAAVVSTDNEEISEVASKAGTAKIVWRPHELSGDRVGDMPVLTHALAEAEKEPSQSFDIVIMLQPTSPLRTSQDVEKCVDKLLAGEWDSVWTVSETNPSYHAKKQVKLSGTGVLEFFLDDAVHVIARQELEPAFHRNGVCYAFKSEFVRSSTSVFSPGRSTAVVTGGRHISIDTVDDLLTAEKLILQLSAPQ